LRVQIVQREHMRISQKPLKNEISWKSKEDVEEYLYNVMD